MADERYEFESRNAVEVAARTLDGVPTNDVKRLSIELDRSTDDGCNECATCGHRETETETDDKQQIPDLVGGFRDDVAWVFRRVAERGEVKAKDLKDEHGDDARVSTVLSELYKYGLADRRSTATGDKGGWTYIYWLTDAGEWVATNADAGERGETDTNAA